MRALASCSVLCRRLASSLLGVVLKGWLELNLKRACCPPRLILRPAHTRSETFVLRKSNALQYHGT